MPQMVNVAILPMSGCDRTGRNFCAITAVAQNFQDAAYVSVPFLKFCVVTGTAQNFRSCR